MITVTCLNDECQQNGTPFDFLGNPRTVECGACHNDCALTDPQPDPPQPDDSGEL